MVVDGFELAYEPKLRRAQEAVGDDPKAVAVEYDKIGGLIRKDGEKVSNGVFYDFEAKAPRTKPEVVEEEKTTKKKTTKK